MSVLHQDPDSSTDPRGICATCGRRMQVRTDGMIRTHRNPEDQRCPGGNQPPQPCADPSLRRRLEALADELDAEAKRHDDAEPINSDGLTRMILAARFSRDAARRIRAALAGDA